MELFNINLMQDTTDFQNQMNRIAEEHHRYLEMASLQFAEQVRLMEQARNHADSSLLKDEEFEKEFNETEEYINRIKQEIAANK